MKKIPIKLTEAQIVVILIALEDRKMMLEEQRGMPTALAQVKRVEASVIKQRKNIRENIPSRGGIS